ncbi:MAG: superoxide dismutase [Planctomycetota bacterium]|jgi:Fe-Mn family superoxide dismutase
MPDSINRREALALAGAGAAALTIPTLARANQDEHDNLLGLNVRGFYEVSELPYDYNALEPHIDEQTMRIHHTKHHVGYVNGLNTALVKLEGIRRNQAEAEYIKHWTRQLAFHGSGHVNHTLFWNCMTPEKGTAPSDALAAHIKEDFATLAKFGEHFKAVASSVEGSGWAWLVVEPLSNRLMILQSEKQQNMASMGVAPILGIDVWEHAYYLKYQNRRSDYITAFMNVINWDFVSHLYGRATS